MNFKSTLIEIDGKKYKLNTWNDKQTGELKTAIFHLNGRKAKNV